MYIFDVIDSKDYVIGHSWGKGYDVETFSTLLALCEGNPLVSSDSDFFFFFFGGGGGVFSSQRREGHTENKMLFYFHCRNTELLMCFVASMNKLLNKHFDRQWFNTPCSLCDITVMISHSQGKP